MFLLFNCVVFFSAFIIAPSLATIDPVHPAADAILRDMPWSVRLAVLNHPSQETKDPEDGRRRFNIQALQLPSRREDNSKAEDTSNDDNNMKMKLFRLMYETVRDSDLKVKRAELIKRSYTNSSSFEIGYLLGDITDKFNIMSDISLTLKRLYHEWRPIEHINAYEQIANLAIDVSHIVDMIKAVEKRLRMGTSHNDDKLTTADYFEIPGK